jgi:hypothetical protein
MNAAWHASAAASMAKLTDGLQVVNRRMISMKTTISAVVLLVCSISAAGAVECYEGRATVRQNAPADKCTQTQKGYANTGKGPLTHDGCTAAKNQAATKLRARLTTSCKAYVQTNQSCTVINVNSCS